MFSVNNVVYLYYPAPMNGIGSREVQAIRMEEEIRRFAYETDEKGNQVLVRSLDSNKRVLLRFTNKTKRHVDVWWRDYTGLKRFYVRLSPVEHYNIDTYVTHPWQFTDAVTAEPYVIANKPIFRPPIHLGGKGYRTNWNITISIRTLRMTALLALGTYIKDPNVVHSLGLPVSLAKEVKIAVQTMHRIVAPRSGVRPLD